MCHHGSEKCANFSLKNTLKALVAGLRPDPLGELTALPQTPYSWIFGAGVETKGRGREITQQRKDWGGRGVEGRTEKDGGGREVRGRRTERG